MNKLAQQRLTEYLDSWLEFRRKRENIPGMVVAISEKGKIIYNQAFGYSNLKEQTKLNNSDIFRIASHSKTFTATSLMQLQEAGKLRIDDKVVTYLPWLGQHSDKRFKKVTIRQLLSHSAGVIRDGKESDFWQLAKPFPTKQQFTDEILKSELVIDNNVKMKYSNYGFTLLGMVVESASGLSYKEYVTKNIINPLGLKNTGPEYTAKINSKLVTGYSREEVADKRNSISQAIDTKVMAPATGFYSNSEDILQYFTAHMIGSNKLLDDESKKEMQRQQFKVEYNPDDEAYGLGLEILNKDGKKYLGHGGGFPGNITKTQFNNESKLVITVLTNCLESQASTINKGVIDAYEYFKNNRPTNKDTLFNGRFLSLWGMAEIVATGKKVIITYPNSWEPLQYPSEAEIIDDNTIKITNENSFLNEGELVRFDRNKAGKINKIYYGGTTMLPEEDYLKQIKDH